MADAVADFSLRSYRLARAAFDNAPTFTNMASGAAVDILEKLPKHSQHPDFGHLVIMVMGAVLEVVCVAFPGYVVARQGMFGAEMQKAVANLNVQLFTPCLVFTKLASQLTADKLADLAVIPVIFVIQTLVSYLCAVSVSAMFRFNKRCRNFVIAMGVFGNSNSLPISLVISLSKTLSGLHWDKIPGDNDNEVAARGILYLLIFQQLGQLLRWSWGYNVLLKPADKYIEDERLEAGRYQDEPAREGEDEPLIRDEEREVDTEAGESLNSSRTIRDFGSGTTTPKYKVQYTDSEDSASINSVRDLRQNADVLATPANGNVVGDGPGNLAGHHRRNSETDGHDHSYSNGAGKPESKTWWQRTKSNISQRNHRIRSSISKGMRSFYQSLPKPIRKTSAFIGRFFAGLWEFMNPPLWAMLIAIIVASVPQLQALFFDRGTFIHNSVTRAISQSGGVAVPLILVVLGANLARNTIPQDQLMAEDPKTERNLLIASLVSRMLLPTIIMAPILALVAKYVPVSILDDPIFVIVAFLLTGAPTALQLAQICQINNVYMGAMSRILFQSYVIWILPSTLILVMLALEVVEWAA